ncbi:MAG: GntR family transcriptional regulator [Alphaproteobacteria bacterium]|nr:GntR family transcriptional regulator [Alphaproteobacteria bacterium]
MQRLKRMLMEGVWSPGERLEALRLADEFGVSMTPVRDSLNQLVGARLVDMKPGEGYRVTRITEQSLRDMLDLNLALLETALSAGAPASQPALAATAGSAYADRVAALFDAIALRAGNTVLTETLKSLGERMHVIRKLEPVVFPDAAHEIEVIERLVEAEDPALQSAIHNYHEQRRRNASALIGLLN